MADDAIGDISHDFETYVINEGERGDLSRTFPKLNTYLDSILKGTEVVKAAVSGEAQLADIENNIAETEAEPSSESAVLAEDASAPKSTATPEVAAGAVAEILPFKAKPKVTPVPSIDSGHVAPAPTPTPLAAKRSGPQEVVKGSAELLEELVNLAGETSIARGQIEEQISEWGFTLEEMDATISRLQEQLRRLDIETEAQILFRQEQMADDDNFDPLEMDRYSQLQQLSRSLIESASDLLDLKSTLGDKARILYCCNSRVLILSCRKV